MQTISGTGAVHLGALFLAKFYKTKSQRTAYFSDPTWANHFQIFSNVGLEHKTYPYFSKKTKGLDFDGMTSAIESAQRAASSYCTLVPTTPPVSTLRRSSGRRLPT